MRGAGLARGKLCYLRAAGCGSRIGDAELLPSPGLRASHCSLLVFLESDDGNERAKRADLQGIARALSLTRECP